MLIKDQMWPVNLAVMRLPTQQLDQVSRLWHPRGQDVDLDPSLKTTHLKLAKAEQAVTLKEEAKTSEANSQGTKKNVKS